VTKKKKEKKRAAEEEPKEELEEAAVSPVEEVRAVMTYNHVIYTSVSPKTHLFPLQTTEKKKKKKKVKEEDE